MIVFALKHLKSYAKIRKLSSLWHFFIPECMEQAEMLPREGCCQGGDVLTEVLRAQGAGYGAHAGAGCERAAGADAGWMRGARPRGSNALLSV